MQTDRAISVIDKKGQRLLGHARAISRLRLKESVALLAALGLMGCATVGDAVEATYSPDDANVKCKPKYTQVYQPPLKLGGSGRLINIKIDERCDYISASQTMKSIFDQKDLSKAQAILNNNFPLLITYEYDKPITVKNCVKAVISDNNHKDSYGQDLSVISKHHEAVCEKMAQLDVRSLMDLKVQYFSNTFSDLVFNNLSSNLCVNIAYLTRQELVESSNDTVDSCGHIVHALIRHLYLIADNLGNDDATKATFREGDVNAFAFRYIRNSMYLGGNAQELYDDMVTCFSGYCDNYEYNNAILSGLLLEVQLLCAKIIYKSFGKAEK